MESRGGGFPAIGGGTAHIPPAPAHFSAKRGGSYGLFLPLLDVEAGAVHSRNYALPLYLEQKGSGKA